MNYVRLAAYAWVAYVTINLLIMLIDILALVFIGVVGFIASIGLSIGSGIKALTGSILGFGIAFIISSLTSLILSAYAVYKIYRWLDKKVREAAVNKLRQLGFNVSPNDMGFLAHRYYLMLLPTPEIEEEFNRRRSELDIRYRAALTTAMYVVITYVLIFTIIYIINIVIASFSIPTLIMFLNWGNPTSPVITNAFTTATVTMGRALTPSIPLSLIGLASGWAYASEELKTIILRRPETTEADIKKVLNAIGQGILDATLY